MEYQPRVYLNGFPKSGLHMLEQAVSSFIRPIASNNWFGTTAFETRIKNRELFDKIMYAIAPGTYAKGHSAYLPEFESAMYGWGIATVFIYRDLRDVVVSTANHMLRATPDGDLKAPDEVSAKYKALDTFEDVLIAVIEGVDGEPGIFERWQLYAGWLNANWVCKVRFEDLRYKPYPTCKRILDYCIGAIEAEHNLNSQDDNRLIVTDMIARMKQRKNSKTFHKGVKAQWARVFTPRVKDCFKAHDNGWLKVLRYAKNDRW